MLMAQPNLMARKRPGLGSILANAAGAPQPFQDPGRAPTLAPHLDRPEPMLPNGNEPIPQTGPVTTSPADARPDYGAILTQALGPRPEMNTGQKIASIVGPMLMAASGNQAAASQMIGSMGAERRAWDDQQRQASMMAVNWGREDSQQDRQWQREDAAERAKRDAPQYFSGNEDRVRFDPTTGQSSVVYDAPQDFEDYAAAQGMEPGSEDYFQAVQDYVLRGNGPTAFQYDSNLETIRNAGRMSMEAARQQGRVGLEGTRQGNRMQIRQTPQARPAAAPRIVTVKTPAEAAKLKPGTQYRGADGVVRQR